MTDHSAPFGHTREILPIWLFDLDNTLYPPGTGLMDAISRRIGEYIERHLRLPAQIAEQMREAYFGAYGSSVRGVLLHCRVEANDFLSFIHDLPLNQYLEPDPTLPGLLGALPGEKYVFTNATAEYASRALRALAIEEHFVGIFDIYKSELEGKPSPLAYERVLEALGRPEGACWLVEDSLANLQTGKLYGCLTAWITPDRSSAPAFVDLAIKELAQLGSTRYGHGPGGLMSAQVTTPY
ncbi:MAG: pyrimidine 5'-nucleotidase [Anaerolineales bacterium]